MIDTSDLHPDLAKRIMALMLRLADEEIVPVKTSGARGFHQQAMLYEKYRKHGGSAVAPMGVSRHHPFYEGKAGAVDLGLPKDMPKADRKKNYARMGVLGRDLGLTWGGDWRSPEPWHFELPGLDPWSEYLNVAGLLDRMRGVFWAKTEVEH